MRNDVRRPSPLGTEASRELPHEAKAAGPRAPDPEPRGPSPEPRTPSHPTSLPRPHYSYEAYADPAMAESFDRRRFGGPIGALVHEREELTLVGLLGEVRGRRVLDVGTGTGRAALALARRGAQVTGIDASPQMLARARERAAGETLDVDFQTGDAHALAFADRAFEIAVCLRVIMHTPDWRRSVGELCRVSGDLVVFDYPALASAAVVQAAARRLRQAVAPGARVEAYRVFSDRAIRAEIERNGFRLVDRRRQFVLPLAAHRAIGSRALTERVEAALAGLGLRSWIGSPVMVVARRAV